MIANATSETTLIIGARAPRRAALLGTVSAIALAQVMGAAAAVAGAGPCSLDATTPGTHVYTCSGTIVTTAGSTSAVSYTVAAGSGVYTTPGSAGNNFTVDSAAEIVTAGAGSHGIAASSLAGNGGEGSNHLYWLPLPGGAGGAGGAVSVTNAGTIYTSGAGSHGVYATSTAGYRGSFDSDTGALGGAGGKGGAVAVSNSGTITTNGAGSHGISAFSTTTSYGNGSGAAGDITVTSSGDITTNGDASHGISAISSRLTSWGQAAGPAGNVSVTSTGNITTNANGAFGIRAKTDIGNVTVTTSGTILAQGANSTGIKAESSSGTVTVTSNGNVTAGHSSSYAINANALGGNATIDIRSNSIVGASNYAIVASSSNVPTINNSGLVRGNIYLSGSSATFNNLAGGIFESGSSVSPNGTTLNNAGTVSPGGKGAIQTTAVVGKFVQTSTGVLETDADWTGNNGAGAADKLEISGKATLAGTVVVNPLNFPTTGGLTKTFNVLTAGGGITNDGITIANTAAVNYALLFPDANTMDLQATINFQGVGTGGLTGNRENVGGALNKVLGGGTTLPFMPALMQLSSGAQLGGALDQLSPVGDGASNNSAMKTAATFASQLLSCRVAGEGDANAVIREGQCLWARASARKTDAETTSNSPGWHETANFFSAGAQFNAGGPWRVGGGIGYETPNLSVNSGSRSEGERLHLGGIVKYNPGPWLLAASVTGGLGWADNVRVANFGGFSGVARSESETSFLTGRLTGAYLMSFGAAYLKPQVDVAHTRLRREGYHETGTGGIALDVAGSNASVWSFAPSLELGFEQRFGGIGIVRPYIKGGVTVRDKDTFATTATFVDAPGIAPFQISSKIDRVMADFGAGIDIIGAGDNVLRLQYDGQAGETTTQHAGSAKVSLRF